MEAKILAVVTKEAAASEGLFVHRLSSAVGAAKPGSAFALRVAREGGAPFWLADLPSSVFTALLSLSSRRELSFAPVSAIVAKLEFSVAPQPHPLITLATAKDAQATFFLPMRLVPGTPPGSGGFTLVGEGSRFDWHAAPPQGKKAPAKAARKGAKKPAAARKTAAAKKGRAVTTAVKKKALVKKK